jgi:hypothetical protein
MPLMTLGTGRALFKAPAAVVAGGPSATFDSANKFQITLSNGDLTMVNSVGAGNFGMARGTASHATGKYYLEFLVDAYDGNQLGIGVCNSSQVIGASVLANSANAVITIGAGSVFSNSSDLGLFAGAAIANGNFICMAIDLDAELGWWRVGSGNWNNNGSANPATGAGGYDISGVVSGSVFPIAESQSSGSSGTLNAGGSAYNQTPPSGFGNW